MLKRLLRDPMKPIVFGLLGVCFLTLSGLSLLAFFTLWFVIKLGFKTVWGLFA